MNRFAFRPLKATTRRILILGLLICAAAPLLVRAQSPQLSLADLLIGLRSKKVTLEERNTILTSAVKQRGVTFVMSDQIEKELAATGASAMLVDAIREKGAVVKISAAVEPPKPAPVEPAPDFAYYQKRADASLVKSEYASAIEDYSKAIEMKPDSVASYLNRGKARMATKMGELAVADFSSAIKIDPKAASGYVNRGMAYELMADSAKAMADYAKALELDNANETAKANLKKLKDEEAKALAKLQPVPEPVKEVVAVKAPEFINMGSLTAADAVRMVGPIYSPMAKSSNITGKVVVDLELDVDGNVVTAKAESGHQLLRDSAEAAARKSKFKPAMFDGKPIKGKATITYNFTMNQ